MPQMAPMMWYMYYMMTIIMLMMICMMIYFSKSKETGYNKMKLIKPMVNWKW
uniref:ATP synthase F0 subunit 8 n=1 Tax=Aradacanthia heissi TaxID=928818 RepID=I6LNM0_9HEMI|nr:ATP synthase F0 subunit 8 [Aradacanthia heissi]